MPREEPVGRERLPLFGDLDEDTATVVGVGRPPDPVLAREPVQGAGHGGGGDEGADR